MIQPQLFRSIFVKTWRSYFWIVFLSVLIYGHIIFFSEYTYFDDSFLIRDNYSKIEKLSDIGRQFFEDVGHLGQGGSLYRPMLNVSFILSAQVSGTALWGHYLLNILLHVGACIFLFILLLNLGVSRSISFLFSALFTIHPALTQSIAYISGRNDSLLAFFILPCFIAFLKFLSSSSYKWYLLHLLFFAMALFTKETTIVFPVISLFYVFVVYNRKITLPQITALIVAWIVVFVNWYFLRIYAQITQLTSPMHVLKILGSDFWIVFFYFGKIFLPFNLSFGPLDLDINILTGIISTLFLIGIIAFSQDRDWKSILFGLLWFGLFLIPTFVYNTNKAEYHIPYYEHRIYVPMIGIVLLLSSLKFS